MRALHFGHNSICWLQENLTVRSSLRTEMLLAGIQEGVLEASRIGHATLDDHIDLFTMVSFVSLVSATPLPLSEF